MQTHSSLAGFVISHSALFSAGVALVVAGMYLHWKLAYHLMKAEEEVKDGVLSEEQARRRIMVLRYSGPVMIVLGASAFGIVLLR